MSRRRPGLEHAVRELKKQIGPGLKGYILDLRNNPGGLLDQAIEVSDDFLTAARSFPRAAVIPTTRSATTPSPATSPTASRSSF